MSTGAIIAIVVVALILLALFAFVLPRMRRQAQVKARERELGQRRERVAEQHRTQANEREREADMADRKAQLAQAEAEKQRAEAQMQQQRAQMHEQGMADHELVDDNERDRFAPVMNDTGTSTERVVDDGRAHEPGTTADSSMSDTTGARSEYEQGRVDERSGRFDREAEREETRRP
jgi:flagellar biosynthesis/type III secretory pathway M-ring protein FliF/YscJ